jgi:hypothetical protein
VGRLDLLARQVGLPVLDLVLPRGGDEVGEAGQEAVERGLELVGPVARDVPGVEDVDVAGDQGEQRNNDYFRPLIG